MTATVTVLRARREQKAIDGLMYVVRLVEQRLPAPANILLAGCTRPRVQLGNQHDLEQWVDALDCGQPVWVGNAESGYSAHWPAGTFANQPIELSCYVEERS